MHDRLCPLRAKNEERAVCYEMHCIKTSSGNKRRCGAQNRLFLPGSLVHLGPPGVVGVVDDEEDLAPK